MLKIRLSRGGAKKRPYYHLVVADVRAPRDGRFVEKVGAYNPMLESTDEKRVVLKTDRIQHWMSKGAQPTDRVARFLVDAGLMKGKKRPEQTKQDKPKAKAQERMREEAELKAAAEEAAKEAAAAEKAAAEAPAEEAPAEDV